MTGAWFSIYERGFAVGKEVRSDSDRSSSSSSSSISSGVPGRVHTGLVGTLKPWIIAVTTQCVPRDTGFITRPPIICPIDVAIQKDGSITVTTTKVP